MIAWHLWRHYLSPSIVLVFGFTPPQSQPHVAVVCRQWCGQRPGKHCIECSSPKAHTNCHLIISDTYRKTWIAGLDYITIHLLHPDFLQNDSRCDRAWKGFFVPNIGCTVGGAHAAEYLTHRFTQHVILRGITPLVTAHVATTNIGEQGGCYKSEREPQPWKYLRPQAMLLLTLWHKPCRKSAALLPAVTIFEAKLATDDNMLAMWLRRENQHVVVIYGRRRHLGLMQVVII